MEEIAGGKHDQVVEEEQVEPTLWSWGAGSDGQLATGTLEDQSLPHPLSFPSVHPIFRMACGGAHAIALTRNGRVFTWGRGTRGQLGHGDLENRLQPELVEFFEGCTVNDISAGWNHSAFATGSGHLFMCGDGSFGQLGNGNNSSHCLPQEVLFFQSMHVEQVACGMRHSLVLVRGSSGYSVYGYGSGRHGQIGRQLRERRKFVSTPEIIHGFEGSTVDFLYANGDHSAALSDGQVYMLGRMLSSYVQKSEQLPDSVMTAPSITNAEDLAMPSLQRIACPIGEKVVGLAAGSEHSVLLTGTFKPRPLSSCQINNCGNDERMFYIKLVSKERAKEEENRSPQNIVSLKSLNNTLLWEWVDGLGGERRYFEENHYEKKAITLKMAYLLQTQGMKGKALEEPNQRMKNNHLFGPHEIFQENDQDFFLGDLSIYFLNLHLRQPLLHIQGWAFADSVLYRLAPLWIGARGLEFTWEYIFQGLEANANLVLNLSLAALVSLMWLRKNKPKSLIPIIYACVIVLVSMPSIVSYVRKALGWQPLKVVGFELISSLFMAFISWQLFESCQRPST
ncbi:hypothetical protein HPP92_019093 [Vanilla planifolia]|uniref:RCC1-like domain-containing protein n=1 Tax=Vanilla planifolia TaxID=51239 RepID=A0A835Q3F3_VANPL|nr:hypothetical protein HPP92_019093 [Vanilla planifolia]